MALKSEDATIQEIRQMVRSGTGVLLVGAGSSRMAGFPSWNSLIDELRQRFAPGLSYTPGTKDLAEFADEILSQAQSADREAEFFKLLDRTFGATGEIHQFHLDLVGLNFAGVATTNYDRVLERAIAKVRSEGDQPFECESADLCNDERPYVISDFFHSLLGRTFDRVLHIHGCHDRPRNLILTKRDYDRAYSGVSSGKPRGQLETIHSRALWALLATRPILFVGFSMSDAHFLRMLRCVSSNLGREGDRTHFVLLPADDKRELQADLIKRAIVPYYYESTDGDHAGLRTLIAELSSMEKRSGAFLAPVVEDSEGAHRAVPNSRDHAPPSCAPPVEPPDPREISRLLLGL